jgi:hypothetical protein
MPRPIHPRPGIPPATNEFQRDIESKLVGDNKVTRDEAADLARTWGNKQLTPEQATQLKASVTNARSTFDAGAVRTLDRFVNVTLPTITMHQGLGVPANSAKLSWTPPTTHEDGTPLTDLKGYKVFFGPSPGNYTKSLDINDPAATSFQVDNLASGTWYFSMKAVDTAGNISKFSNEAAKTIP